jgi:hypothetical protein
MKLGVYLSQDGNDLIIIYKYVECITGGMITSITEYGHISYSFSVSPFNEWHYLGEL